MLYTQLRCSKCAAVCRVLVWGRWCVWVRLSGACMLCVVCVHDRSTHTCLQTARHAQRSTIFRQNHHILMVPKSTLIAHITTQQYNIWLSFFWTFFLPVTENLTENPSLFPTKCSCMYVCMESGRLRETVHELRETDCLSTPMFAISAQVANLKATTGVREGDLRYCTKKGD